MDFLSKTRRFCPELAEEIHAIAEKSFTFASEHPSVNSQFNSEYLWLAEHRADRFKQINLRYRVEMVQHIIERWKQNLRGYRPYQDSGYRIHMWRSLGPKISVAQYQEEQGTDIGVELIESLERFLRPFAQRSWGDLFSGSPIDLSEVLRTVERMRGSIGKPTAERLGMTRGELRKLIEQVDLVDDVNRIRKHFKRRPAALNPFPVPRRLPMHEIILPPRY